MYYKRYEVQWRMSLFFSASILAGAFSGLLAFAIAKMHDVGGLEAWHWYVVLRSSATSLANIETQDLYTRRSSYGDRRHCRKMVDSRLARNSQFSYRGRESQTHRTAS